jgi:hypothetical protein
MHILFSLFAFLILFFIFNCVFYKLYLYINIDIMFKANLYPYNESKPLTDNKLERSLHAKHDNFRFEHTGYYPLIDHGTYYYPAWKHYNRKTKVFCDRCHRQDLRAAVGYANFDLCLLCVDELTRLNFDCPSRHCHESKFINDNSVSFNRPEYVDLNRYYYHQQYDMKDKADNSNQNKRIEHFSLNDMKKGSCMPMIVLIIIIISVFLFVNRTDIGFGTA